MKSLEILKLLTQDDINSRRLFTHAFKAELKIISEISEENFELIDSSDCAGDDSHRAALVKGYLMLTAESVISATQLLSLGHVSPSGNSMRVSYEALCFSALLKKDIEIQVSRGSHKFSFYDDYCNGRRNSRADQVVSLFIKNSKLLGLNENGKSFIKTAKDFYNGYSHASDLLLHSKINPSTLHMYVGGGYDNEQQPLYSEHVKFIIRYIKQIPSWIKVIANNAT
ncbi:hypothetical protein BM526_02580 [Alteromonas mediterranea]|uniref:hypothetical protein n=1 Tax=Alteromonas mediterranea TaxID=314275 RepID=UPI000904317D|nr:hypothetical protein [Alteromonas mediterranea]APE00842.1 hypothetical protein BM526_02580 [Alteromonas mediterranea]